jgi:predicted TIM-barrel fold metal-dependent hydrolase
MTRLDIVDAQVHLSKVGTRKTIAAMDAIGVAQALYHEHEGRDADRNHTPHHKLENGFARPFGAHAEVAARRYPDRLQLIWQIDPRDPDLDAVVRLVRASPHLRALRMCMANPAEIALLDAGGCAPAFAVAQKYGLPLMVLAARRAPSVRQYLEQFPDLTIVLDHCGIPAKPEDFAETLALARFPNLALKWCHAVDYFPSTGYPFREWDPYLKAAVEHFGAQRIMWASDFTEDRGKCTWAESLFYLRNTPVLAQSDREWILGRTVRTLFNWPKPAS